jgi:hypothetical protein
MGITAKFISSSHLLDRSISLHKERIYSSISLRKMSMNKSNLRLRAQWLYLNSPQVKVGDLITTLSQTKSFRCSKKRKARTEKLLLLSSIIVLRSLTRETCYTTANLCNNRRSLVKEEFIKALKNLRLLTAEKTSLKTLEIAARSLRQISKSISRTSPLMRVSEKRTRPEDAVSWK